MSTSSRVFDDHTSGAAMAALGLGLLVGASVALLVAPMRGRQLRESLRTHVDHALERSVSPFEEGRRLFRTQGSEARANPAPLTATLGEIAQMHAGEQPGNLEVRS